MAVNKVPPILMQTAILKLSRSHTQKTQKDTGGLLERKKAQGFGGNGGERR